MKSATKCFYTNKRTIIQWGVKRSRIFLQKVLPFLNNLSYALTMSPHFISLLFLNGNIYLLVHNVCLKLGFWIFLSSHNCLKNQTPPFSHKLKLLTIYLKQEGRGMLEIWRHFKKATFPFFPFLTFSQSPLLNSEMA
jgi:hypothetical protein